LSALWTDPVEVDPVRLMLSMLAGFDGELM
jgi:hypothetical protein